MPEAPPTRFWPCSALGAHAVLIAVETGLPGASGRHGHRDCRVFMRPVEPGAGEQPYRAAIEAGMLAKPSNLIQCSHSDTSDAPSMSWVS